MMSFEVFIDINFQAALLPKDQISPLRNEYQKYFLVVKLAAA
jgi:hypothetical protein